MSEFPNVQVTNSKDNNPLLNFGRKTKLKLELPSHGKWYPKGSLNLNDDGTVDIKSMTGADDLRFKAGDASFSGQNFMQLIKSCVPNILIPEEVPSIDLDSLLLNIRWASYGQFLDVVVDVPNTNLTRKVTVDLATIAIPFENSKNGWDEQLIITNEENSSITFFVRPIKLKTMFEKTRDIQKQKSQIDAHRVDGNFNDVVDLLSDMAVDLIIESIDRVVVGEQIFQGTNIVADLVKNLDVEYFNAIKNHIADQKAKFTYKINTQISNEKELDAGAPESWDADLQFAGSDFFKS